MGLNNTWQLSLSWRTSKRFNIPPFLLRDFWGGPKTVIGVATVVVVGGGDARKWRREAEKHNTLLLFFPESIQTLERCDAWGHMELPLLEAVTI